MLDSKWDKRGQRDQAAVGVRKDKGIRQQLGQERTKGSGSSWGKKGQRDQAAMGIRKDEGMMAAVECKIKSDLRQQLGEREKGLCAKTERPAFMFPLTRRLT